jgi:hypothetical protein
MVTQYGMGTELASKQLPADDYSMSDHTRRTIDEEQQYLTDLAHRRAMKIVGENRELLEALAQTLLENEVLERDDITRLVAEHRGSPALVGKERFARNHMRRPPPSGRRSNAPILPESGWRTTSGSPEGLKARNRTDSSVRFTIWCAPCSPRGNETTSPCSSSRQPSGVRRLGVPRSTITSSSSVICAW